MLLFILKYPCLTLWLGFGSLIAHCMIVKIHNNLGEYINGLTWTPDTDTDTGIVQPLGGEIVGYHSNSEFFLGGSNSNIVN